MAKSKIPAPAGEVVLVSKSATAEAPKIREISQKEYERRRPKKELSEKQKENLAKLIERNKARAATQRATVTHAIPDEVPEDQELVIVKPKRKYVRKVKNEIIYPETETETETEQETEQETESEAEIPLRRALTRIPKPTKKPAKKPAKKPTKSYRYDTETTSQSESESESEDERVSKYAPKIEKRLEAVRSIDQRLQQIQRPISKLSIF